MAKGTKKVGIAGKYGARYGVKVRKQITQVEQEKVKRHVCPRCKHKSVKRVSTGIWKCNRCNLKFASGAYAPYVQKAQAIPDNEVVKEEGLSV